MTSDLFTTLTVRMHEFVTVEDTVQGIADALLRTTLSDQAAVLLPDRRGGLSVAYSTGATAQQAAELQLRSGAGPNLAEVADGYACVIPDTATETRWPDWARQATELSVRSCLAVPMASRARYVGSLLLVSRHSYRFGTVDAMLANALAGHAAAAIDCARRTATLSEAVDSRTTIGQAQGILMAQRNVGDAEAFQLLKRHSQHTNIRLRDVAEHVVTTGKLPSSSRQPKPSAGAHRPRH